MRKGLLIRVASWLEIIVGAALVLALDLLSRLLFAEAPQGVGGLLGRVGGLRSPPLALAVCAPRRRA